MESISSSLSIASFSKSFFSCPSIFYSYKLKIEESVKNEVEIDTIDNDDEKKSIEVSENMTQYPTIPFKTYFLTKKNRI